MSQQVMLGPHVSNLPGTTTSPSAIAVAVAVAIAIAIAINNESWKCSFCEVHPNLVCMSTPFHSTPLYSIHVEFFVVIN